MSDTMLLFAQLGTLFGGIAALGALGFNGYALLHAAKARRLETLAGLQSRFYTSSEFGEVRRLIESGSNDELRALMQAVKASPENDRFDGYLNFFEWIAFLEKKRSLNKEEVGALFGYCLESMSRRPEIVAYIDRYSYENLSLLLKKVKAP